MARLHQRGATPHAHDIQMGHDAVANIFFGGRRRRVFTELAVLSGAQPGNWVLDVGCGTGYFTRVVAERLTPEGTVHGVDPSKEAIARAVRLARHTNCTFSEGVAEALDAPDRSYDVVVSSLMIHHLPEPVRPQAIGEMFRVLRPGGGVLVAEFRPPTNPLGLYLIRPVTSSAMQHNPLDVLEPLLRDAGFQQVRSGDVRPWIRYVQAVKPTSDP